MNYSLPYTQYFVPCQDYCKSCSDSSTCLECETNFSLMSGTCLCPKRFFIKKTLACEPCSDECLDCNSIDFCLSCLDQNSFPSVNSKDSLCLCNDGFYKTKSKNSSDYCLPCKRIA